MVKKQALQWVLDQLKMTTTAKIYQHRRQVIRKIAIQQVVQHFEAVQVIVLVPVEERIVSVGQILVALVIAKNNLTPVTIKDSADSTAMARDIAATNFTITESHSAVHRRQSPITSTVSHKVDLSQSAP